jgi:TetR/AcrR family tetracycline transcriptional repressor
MALSREDVLAGALGLLDEVGLDGLTMRRLAEALDVQAGAIYYHFKDKQELLDAMSDALMAGVMEPPLEGAWDEVLADMCRRLVERMTSHRDAARLATMSLTPGPHGLAAAEAMMRELRRARLSKEALLWGASVLGYYILGYATDVQATEAAKARGMTAIAASLREQLDPVRHRELLAMTEGESALEHMMSPRELRRRFEFGLALILDGLKAHAAARASARQARAAKARSRAAVRARRK